MNRYLILALLVLISLSLPALAKRLTHSFHLTRCESPFVYTDPPQIEFDERILHQDFHYLARGSQAFVFSSQDGLYVLKLFFFDSQKLSLVRQFLGAKSKGFSAEVRRKVAKTLKGSHLALLRAKEETGLIYVHLNPTQREGRVCLCGPAWHREQIPIYRYRFAIQRFATPLETALKEARKNNDRQLFDQRVQAVQALLRRRISLGIHNSDPLLVDNCGLLGERAIEIDFGNYALAEDHGEFEWRNRRLQKWIQDEIAPW